MRSGGCALSLRKHFLILCIVPICTMYMYVITLIFLFVVFVFLASENLLRLCSTCGIIDITQQSENSVNKWPTAQDTPAAHPALTPPPCLPDTHSPPSSSARTIKHPPSLSGTSPPMNVSSSKRCSSAKSTSACSQW